MLDPDDETIHLHRAGQSPQAFGMGVDFVLPELDALFRVAVDRFFD